MGDWLNQYNAVVVYLIPVGIILGATLAGLIIEVVVLRRVAKWAEKTTWKGDDAILHALRGKVVIWSLLLGINAALAHVPFHIPAPTLGLSHQILTALFILTVTSGVASAAAGLIRSPVSPDARPALSLVTTSVQVVVYVIGILIVLDVFAISITPALAALGVTGLAVSLALQGTLTDLISGIQIIASRQVRPGDFIRLENGEEGYVTDVNWRTTRIRQITNNMVIMPNSQITTSMVLNFHEPERALLVPVPLGVSYASDLEFVERVTLEVAHEVMAAVEGGITPSEPFIRYTTFGDSSINFTVYLHCAEYADNYLVKHEFIKRLHRRYNTEGIDIPFPTQTVYVQPQVAAPARITPPVQAIERGQPSA